MRFVAEVVSIRFRLLSLRRDPNELRQRILAPVHFGCGILYFSSVKRVFISRLRNCGNCDEGFEPFATRIELWNSVGSDCVDEADGYSCRPNHYDTREVLTE